MKQITQLLPSSKSATQYFLLSFAALLLLLNPAFGQVPDSHGQLPKKYQDPGGAQSMGQDGNQQDMRPAILDLFDQTSVPSVTRKVDNSRPIVLTGAHGTKVNIPANAFVTLNGEPVIGPVEIEMKEVFNKSEILLSNCPTVSNGELLESGGMVYLDARSDGKPVRIAPGKTIDIDFPKGQPTEGMQLFSGEYDPEGNMDWTPVGSPSRAPKRHQKSPLTADPNTLIFADGERDVRSYVYSLLEKRTSCCGNDNITVELTYDDNGKTNHVRTVGYNACYYKSIIDIMQYVEWDMSQSKGEKKITFNLSPEKFCEGNSYKGGTYAKVSPDQQFALYDEKYKDWDKRKEIRANSQEFATNTLKVSQLGWINCDRFPQITARSDFFVNVTGNDAKDFARVFIVFEEMRAVMNGSETSLAKHQFSGMPKGVKATVVAISYMDEKPFVGTKKITIGGNTETVAMQETTVEGLKKLISGFDG